MNSLVSIVTPVYNGIPYLDCFLNSVLHQTYPRIELILVDDGSTDDIQGFVEPYKERFQRKGYAFIFIRQPHAGQAAAINTGLHIFSGDYFFWMDADDMLEKECIEQLVVFLESRTDCDFVICDARYVDYETGKTMYIKCRSIPESNHNYFFDILRGTHNYSLGCGTTLVRRDIILKAIPPNGIFVSDQGQNMQLMLPLTYFYKYDYLHKPLFVRYVRNNSHSHGKRTYSQELQRQYEFITLAKETVKSMNISEMQQAFSLIEKRFGRRIFELAYHNFDYAEAKRIKDMLVSNQDFGFADRIKLVSLRSRFLYRSVRKLNTYRTALSKKWTDNGR